MSVTNRKRRAKYSRNFFPKLLAEYEFPNSSVFRICDSWAAPAPPWPRPWSALTRDGRSLGTSWAATRPVAALNQPIGMYGPRPVGQSLEGRRSALRRWLPGYGVRDARTACQVVAESVGPETSEVRGHRARLAAGGRGAWLFERRLSRLGPVWARRGAGLRGCADREGLRRPVRGQGAFRAALFAEDGQEGARRRGGDELRGPPGLAPFPPRRRTNGRTRAGPVRTPGPEGADPLQRRGAGQGLLSPFPVGGP